MKVKTPNIKIVAITAFIIALTQFVEVVDKLAAKYVIKQPAVNTALDINGNIKAIPRGTATGIIDTTEIIKAQMVQKREI